MLYRCGYRFRLKPTVSEDAALRRFAGCCRFVWNQLLAENERQRQAGLTVQSYGAMCRRLTILKAEYPFLREAYANVLQQTLRDLSTGYARAFNRRIDAGFPRFKKKGRSIGIRFPTGFRINGSGLYLPKLGWVGFRKSREIQGRVTNVTVMFDGHHWYVSMQTENEFPELTHPSTTSVGVDLGIEHFAALSDGSYVEGPNALKKHLGRLRRLQRSVDRKRLFSKNWRKAQLKVSSLHRRIAWIRSDAIHKASTTISKNHAFVVLEKLQIPNMIASARGTLEKPGTSVRAKRGLNRRISDQGWAQFCHRLEYKMKWRGGSLCYVDARDTSRTCAVCEHVSEHNRKTQARFRCGACGHTANADTNAAINILRRAGQARIACGEMRLRVSAKQEAQLAFFT